MSIVRRRAKIRFGCANGEQIRQSKKERVTDQRMFVKYIELNG